MKDTWDEMSKDNDEFFDYIECLFASGKKSTKDKNMEVEG